MASIAARKQARRFFGTMGATMRRTSRWMEAGRNERTDYTFRRAYGYPATAYAEPRELMAR